MTMRQLRRLTGCLSRRHDQLPRILHVRVRLASVRHSLAYSGLPGLHLKIHEGTAYVYVLNSEKQEDIIVIGKTT
jgi:hypothetical protein